MKQTLKLSLGCKMYCKQSLDQILFTDVSCHNVAISCNVRLLQETVIGLDLMIKLMYYTPNSEGQKYERARRIVSQATHRNHKKYCTLLSRCHPSLLLLPSFLFHLCCSRLVKMDFVVAQNLQTYVFSPSFIKLIKVLQTVLYP